jgi:hypothetical protein
MKLRTRYRIVFLYYENDGKKCLTDETPSLYKLSGAVDGDSFNEYRQMAMEVEETIPNKCIVKDGSGVCVITYEMKDPYKKKHFTSKPFSYKGRVSYVLTTTKTGVKRAYKVDSKGKKSQTNYKKAKKNDSSQKRRILKAQQKHTFTELDRRTKFDNQQATAETMHRTKKKIVLKQYARFQGCYSPDMAYKGG